MTQSNIAGIVVPIITPLLEGDRVDEATFRKNIRRLIDAGVGGLFIGGSAGEGPLLTQTEWTRMIEIAYDENNGRVSLLGGVMDTSSRRIAERLKILAQIGYQYYVVLPVFYISHTSPEEHLRLFADCKEADDGMELIAYNLPTNARCEIPVEILVEAARRGWVKYCKDSSCNFDYLSHLISEGAEVGLQVLTGDESRVVQGIRAGAVGVVPVCANYDPEVFVRAYQATLDSDDAVAQSAQERIQSLRDNLVEHTGACWLSGMKYAMSTLGLGENRLASPILPLTADQQNKVDAFLKTINPVAVQ